MEDTKQESVFELLDATRADAEQTVAIDVRAKQTVAMLERMGIAPDEKGMVPFKQAQKLAERIVESGERQTDFELRLMKDVKRSAVSGPNIDRGYLMLRVTTPAGNQCSFVGAECHWNPNIRDANGHVKSVWVERDDEYPGYQLGSAMVVEAVSSHTKRQLGYTNSEGKVTPDLQLTPDQKQNLFTEVFSRSGLDVASGRLTTHAKKLSKMLDKNNVPLADEALDAAQIARVSDKIRSLTNHAMKNLAVETQYPSNPVVVMTEEIRNTAQFNIIGAREPSVGLVDITEEVMVLQEQKAAAAPAAPPVDPNAAPPQL